MGSQIQYKGELTKDVRPMQKAYTVNWN